MTSPYWPPQFGSDRENRQLAADSVRIAELERQLEDARAALLDDQSVILRLLTRAEEAERQLEEARETMARELLRPDASK